MEFQHQHVVVTGGTGLLGRAICTAFLAQGATVYASYLFERELTQLPPEMLNNPNVVLRKVDLTSEQDVTDWFESIGRVNVLVNVAGGFAMSTIEQTSLKDWEFMMDMNLKTSFLCSREGLKHMRRHASGRIINVGAFAATKANPGMGPYTVSKSGVLHMTQVMAEETLGEKITVNAVLPTIMDTPGNRAAMPEADFSTWVPLDGVADTVLFLARDSSWFITGALIPLRGHL